DEMQGQGGAGQRADEHRAPRPRWREAEASETSAERKTSEPQRHSKIGERAESVYAHERARPRKHRDDEARFAETDPAPHERCGEQTTVDDRDGIAGEAIGIAASVHSLVVVADDRGACREELEGRHDLRADEGMAPHERPLL